MLSTVETKERFDDEGVRDSGRAEELLYERFRRELVPTEERLINARGERLIFSNPSLDVDDPAFRSTVDRLVQDLRALPQVQSAVSYYDTNDPDMVAADRNAVLGFVVTQADPERPFGRIDFEPVLDTVRANAESASGFEIGIVSNRLIEDQLEEIVDEDFQRILFISLGVGLVTLLLAFRTPLRTGRALRRDDPVNGSGRRHRLLSVCA